MCLTGSSAGGHHNHGHGGVAEVSETKAEAEAVLSTGGKHEHGHEQLHSCIGISLVLGFVFMLLVDQIGSSHVHSTEGQSIDSLSSLWRCFIGFIFCLLIIKLSLLFNGLDPESARVASSKITTTLGLVVHAAGGTHTGLKLSDMKPRFHRVP